MTTSKKPVSKKNSFTSSIFFRAILVIGIPIIAVIIYFTVSYVGSRFSLSAESAKKVAEEYGLTEVEVGPLVDNFMFFKCEGSTVHREITSAKDENGEQIDRYKYYICGGLSVKPFMNPQVYVETRYIE